MIELLTIFLETEGDPRFLLLAGPASGFAFYALVYLYYRNTNKSHSFESETSISTRNLKAADQRIGDRKGTRDTRIQGDNSKKHRQRVQFRRS